jgi:hypothetical protein
MIWYFSSEASPASNYGGNADPFSRRRLDRRLKVPPEHPGGMLAEIERGYHE